MQLFPLEAGGKQLLSNRWSRLMQRLGCRGGHARMQVLDELFVRYAEPHRHYHNLQHVYSMLDKKEKLNPTLELAIWFHDAIYDTTRNNNEELSAQLAEHHLGVLGVAPAMVATCAQMILCTKHHQATTPEETLLVDKDLAILGASPKMYMRYTLAVRKEFGWVPQRNYVAGRLVFLEKMLKHPQLSAHAKINLLEEQRALSQS